MHFASLIPSSTVTRPRFHRVSDALGCMWAGNAVLVSAVGLFSKSFKDVKVKVVIDFLPGRSRPPCETINNGTLVWETTVLHYQLCCWSSDLLVSVYRPTLRDIHDTNFCRFSFGYDQGVMGGVNTSPDYVRTMKLGYSTSVLILQLLPDSTCS